ncbi:hypothetical protein BJX68DRAFT_262741 [Aspergillus pseudodeflectus]|uniref:SRm160/300 splicing coactivator n=1 Tax=Aspergillus pseudodeflectus TaxID=176178 RepID=A0ABR4L0Z7_9EURO
MPPANNHSPANRGGSAKSTPMKSKPVDIGLPLGLYDTNSVRSKVRKWQQQGGGVITADDVIYYEDDDENLSTPETKPRSVKGREERIATRKRSKSTPRKRLVSDEHWKLNRTSTQAPSSRLPAPKRIAEYTTNEPARTARSEKGGDKKDEKLPPLLSPRSKRREDDKEKAPPALVMRERAKSHASRDIDSIIEKIEKEHASYDKPSKATSRPTTADKNRYSTLSEPSQSPKKKDTNLDYDSEWAASEADFSELSRRRARGPAHSKNRTPAKPPKGGILGQIVDESRKMFSKPDAQPPRQPVPNRGSKIEAWLSNTQDPFLDDKDADVEIPAPLKTRRNKSIHSSFKEEEREPKPRISSPEPSVDSDFSRRTSKRRIKSGGTAPSSERPKSRDDKSAARESQRDTSPSPQRRKSSEHRSRRSSSRSNGESKGRVEEDVSDIGTYPLSGESEVSGNNAPVPLGRTRPFPTTGLHRLSTIASVESMSTRIDGKFDTVASDVTEKKRKPSQSKDDGEERDHVDLNSLSVVSSHMKKLTTHDDLISVLSAPTRSRSLRSARSLRSNKNRNPTVADILKELSLDEAKYMRELRTLVGGVIPVLLTCVLSRSDSAIAAGLFRPSADPGDELTFTKPIVNMGVAIERLKLLHKRIPLEAADALIQWAQGAQKVYREYLKAWRLGFKDVVVNLAPLEEGDETNNAETKSLDEGMSRDENGDVVDAEGQKVDVAYLLKRPLVRLKYLAKTFKGINMLEPSPKAEEVSVSYQNLVAEARRRAREERARLEDESAAAVDATRARDPETLGALTGVQVDKTRRVRARDFFNLSLYHSSGQVIDCRAELLFRDNAPEHGPGGDLLICEIDHADRWLLFPPVDITCVSARHGDKKGELVVMIRSAPTREKRFQELLSLQIDEEDVGREWLQMLGRTPVPPAISRSQSFIDRARQRQRAQTISSPNDVSLAQRAPPSPSSIAIPIGEKPTSRASRRSWTAKEAWSDPSTIESTVATESQISSQTDITRESDYDATETEVSAPSSSQPQPILHSRDPRKLVIGDDKSPQGLKRSGAKRISKYGELTPQSPLLPPSPISSQYPSPSTPSRDETKRAEQATATAPREKTQPKTPTRAEPEESPRISSTPSRNLPSIPKLRQGSSTSYIPEPESDEEYDILDYNALPETPTKRKTHSRSGSESDGANGDEPPPPPPHSRSPSSTGSSLTNTPVLSPTAARLRRRGSSPLKHEYEPSTASDSYSDSDTSTVRRYDMYSDSDTVTDSSDEDSEDDLPPRTRRTPSREITKPTVQESDLSPATSTLSLSNSTNQAGYRSVPSQPNKSSSAIATVFAWSDKGSWENVLPDECKIVISPGLVEAYEMKDDPLASTADSKARPLVALELTPLVPIRRGTAIDISIRSPPTQRSKVNWSNNIMFRSRNADECEALYGLINQSRINNPTYIALQNARGPMADLPMPLERTAKSSGFFGWPRRRKSYRASGSPRSIADNSESSVGTMSSAFSAIKRFGAGSKMFSISRSSVTSRNRNKDGEGGSLFSSSAASGAGSNGGSIGRIAAAIKGVDGIGLSNAKIRLYIRETQSKWRDMGAARLTIMPAPPSEPRRPDTAFSPEGHTEGSPDTTPPGSGAASPGRVVEAQNQKRIVIRGKTRGEVLLDVCLDESCFERVARTGIAVSVREEAEEGPAVASQGGVTTGDSTVYMIQMKGEAEAAYTFGLVGKMKY